MTGIIGSVPLMTVIIGSVPLLTGKIGPFLSEVRNNRLGPIKGSEIECSFLLEVRNKRFGLIRGQEEQFRSH
jgi:hypothetical protein